MTKSVILPNGDFAEFPDDMTDEQASFAAEQQWAARQQDPEQVAGVRKGFMRRFNHPAQLLQDGSPRAPWKRPGPRLSPNPPVYRKNPLPIQPPEEAPVWPLVPRDDEDPRVG